MFVLNKHLDVDTYYLPLPINCRLIDAQSAIDTQALSVADGTVTFSDGTTDIGTITVTQSGNAEGDVDSLVLDSTSLGKVALGPSTPLKIVLAGNTNGEVEVTMVFDEFHAAST
jgi:hypothetical protein